ncbi:MAG: peptidyl-tRNA hydrolase Pth2 [Candidatus Thermoplasmatota archaeon]
MNFEYKMAIITRKDLDLTPGKLAVQVAHAAVNCAFETKKRKKDWFKKWEKTGAKKAVLKTDCVEDFYFLKENAEELEIATSLVKDAGHTEIQKGTKTVLGIGPAPSNLIDKVTGDLTLL